MNIRKIMHLDSVNSELKTENVFEGDKTIIKSLYSMVSLGTEKLVVSGKVDASLTEYLRVPHMEGSFDLPCTYGYSLVGEALSGPEAGKKVHMLHPHQDYAFVENHDMYEVPDTINPKKAVFASNLETALNAVWDSRATLGDKILILGFGTIGAFTAYLLSRIPGIKVQVSEINEKRAKVAEELGFTLWKGKSNFDIAFNTTSSEKALQTAIDHTRKNGKIVELSWYGKEKVTVNLGYSFHYNRKQIISSQVSSLPPDRFGWTYRKRKKLIFELLSDEFFDKLPVKIIPFKDSATFFEDLRKDKVNEFCVLIKY